MVVEDFKTTAGEKRNDGGKIKSNIQRCNTLHITALARFLKTFFFETFNMPSWPITLGKYSNQRWDQKADIWEDCADISFFHSFWKQCQICDSKMTHLIVSFTIFLEVVYIRCIFLFGFLQPLLWRPSKWYWERGTLNWKNRTTKFGKKNEEKKFEASAVQNDIDAIMKRIKKTGQTPKIKGGGCCSRWTIQVNFEKQTKIKT